MFCRFLNVEVVKKKKRKKKKLTINQTVDQPRVPTTTRVRRQKEITIGETDCSKISSQVMKTVHTHTHTSYIVDILAHTQPLRCTWGRGGTRGTSWPTGKNTT